MTSSSAGAGNDLIGGDDGTFAGPAEPGGNDVIFGGIGDDQIIGETGSDAIEAGAGNDSLPDKGAGTLCTAATATTTSKATSPTTWSWEAAAMMRWTATTRRP
jgi:Ca2+-binding RTX toxin-like protein